MNFLFKLYKCILLNSICVNHILMKTKILISAANGIVMRSLINRLKTHFYVVGIDNNSNGDAKKYCDEFYQSPSGDSKEFIKFLLNIGKKVDFIFLYVDEEIRTVIKYRRLLFKIKTKLILSNSKTINICLNKKKFLEFCKISKIDYPSEKYKKKMIAKPIFGRGSKNIFVIKNKFDYEFFRSKKNYITQQYIDGKEYTIDCLFDSYGNLIFGLPRLRLVHRGVSIVGKIVKNNTLIKYVKNLSKKIKFNGPINIQVIIDKNKKIWILEVNPRLSGSIEFSIKAGFNPLLYYKKNKKRNFNSIKYNKIFKRFYALS